ncbi:MAG TPA: hypothetical protein VIN40_03350 [Candidatus Tyrphobacter sp.]
MVAPLALVLAFSLPPHVRIAPEQQRVPMRVAADGTIAATVTDASGMPRILTWNHERRPRLISPSAHLDPGELSASLELGGFDGTGIIYATLVKSMELEAGGNQTLPGVYPSGAFVPLDLKRCSAIAPSDFLPHVERVAGDVVYLTYESPDSTEVLDGDQTSDFAPYAVRLDGSSCVLLGRASIRDVSGDYVVGFRGYLGTFIAPTDFDTDSQRYVAVRIHQGSLTELGPGVAMAVAADGTAVGADAPPGFHQTTSTTVNGRTSTTSCCTPHAMLWRVDGTLIALAPNARSSVAYAVDDDGTVGGMLIDAAGKHRAFVWRNGTLRLLDDAVHAPGWRFEAVFAFGLHHEILGVGTHNGTAMVFEVSRVFRRLK